MKKIIASTIALATLSGAAYAQNIKDLEKRIEDLELSRDLNIFNFSGEFETDYVNHNSTNNKTKVGTNKDSYLMYLRLNVEAKPSERLTFFGRLAMSKRFNNFSSRETSSGAFSNTGAAGRNLNGPELYIERAFINYDLTKSLTFTAGRLPTIEGPSNHFSKGAARSGTYPLLAYATILDGVALTHSANVLGGTLATRAIWTPVNFHNRNADTLDSNTTDSSGVKIDSTSPLYAVMTDYEKTGLSFADKFNGIVQFVSLSDFYVDSAEGNCIRQTPIGTTPGPCLPAGTETKLSNLRWDYSALALYSEFSNLFNSNVDFSFSWKKTKVKSEGSISSLATAGILTGKTKDEVKGNIFLGSVRYTFLSKFKIGYEWLKASERAFTVGGNSFDPLSFYSTPASEGHHVYLTTDFDSNLRLVLGYQTMNIERTYSSGIVGGGTATDLDRTAGYARLIANF